MPTEPDDRPRVILATPTRGGGRVDAQRHQMGLASRGAVEVIPTLSFSSILDHGFNRCWAKALDWQAAGIIDYFLMAHDDIQPMTNAWVDVLVAEARRVGAAVLSVVQAIKDASGDTSTALETDNVWAPRRLHLCDLEKLPETFCAADTDRPGRPLLVNSGLMLVDLSRPEFHELDDEGCLKIFFHTRSRVWKKPDGNLVAQVRSEDWEFSRLCHRAGLPVYATTLVECQHWGERAHSNVPPGRRERKDNLIEPVSSPERGSPLVSAPKRHYCEGVPGWTDAGLYAVYRDAVARTPDGGWLVEVGVWQGKSLSYLLVEAANSGKRLRIRGVDTFEGSPGEPDMVREARRTDIEAACHRHLARAGYPYGVVRGPSVEVAAQFTDRSLDFVFVDAAHTAEAVEADVRAWLPKVKAGGVIAGHDYGYPAVRAGVHAVLPAADVVDRHSCWWYEVREDR